MQNRRYSPDTLVQLSDDELLKIRLKDLHLQITGTEVESFVHQLYDELNAKG